MSRAHRRRILLRRRYRMKPRPGGWWATDEVWEMLRRQMAKPRTPDKPGEFRGIPIRTVTEVNDAAAR